MHRRALLLCWAVTFVAVPARADVPSFDCGKATTPIEQLVCDDPELIRLDGLLGLAYTSKLAGSDAKDAVKAEQRAWLESRFERCPIAKTGKALTPAQTWEAAPCLAALYAERVTALGGDPAIPAPSPAAAEPGFIHPICLELALGSDLLENAPPPAPIPLAACNRGNRHRLVTTGDTGIPTAADAHDGYEGSFWYDIAGGALADGRRAALTWYWGGGSGVFTNVVALSEPAPGELAAKIIVPGGDRCLGGISGVRIVGRTIEVTSKITAADFVSLGNAEPSERLTSGLPGCAICCMAELRHRYDPATKRTTLLSATITDSSTEPESDVEKCAFAIVRRAPRTLDAAQTNRLIADIIAECDKNE